MWVPSPGPNAERRQSVGAPRGRGLVGALPRAERRREKTAGRGAPCGCPPHAERRQPVGAPLVGALPRAERREKTIGRGTPCGCPPPAERRPPPLVGALPPLWVPSPPCGCPPPLVGAPSPPCGCVGALRTVQIIVRSRPPSKGLCRLKAGFWAALPPIGRAPSPPCGRPS